jgi:hypothetical protein
VQLEQATSAAQELDQRVSASAARQANLQRLLADAATARTTLECKLSASSETCADLDQQLAETVAARAAAEESARKALESAREAEESAREALARAEVEARAAAELSVKVGLRGAGGLAMAGRQPASTPACPPSVARLPTVCAPMALAAPTNN